MSVVSLEEGFDVGRAQLVTALDLLLQQKVIELATFGQQFAACVASITFGLEISGKTVEMRTEQTAPEIDQGAFFFEPVFEHKIVVEKDWGKVNDQTFMLEDIPEKRSAPLLIQPLGHETRYGI